MQLTIRGIMPIKHYQEFYKKLKQFKVIELNNIKFIPTHFQIDVSMYKEDNVDYILDFDIIDEDSNLLELVGENNAS